MNVCVVERAGMKTKERWPGHRTLLLHNSIQQPQQHQQQHHSLSLRHLSLSQHMYNPAFSFTSLPAYARTHALHPVLVHTWALTHTSLYIFKTSRFFPPSTSSTYSVNSIILPPTLLSSPHAHPHALSHALTHALTHAFTHTHTLLRTCTRSNTPSFAQLRKHSFIPSQIQPHFFEKSTCCLSLSHSLSLSFTLALTECRFFKRTKFPKLSSLIQTIFV